MIGKVIFKSGINESAISVEAWPNTRNFALFDGYLNNHRLGSDWRNK